MDNIERERGLGRVMKSSEMKAKLEIKAKILSQNQGLPCHS